MPLHVRTPLLLPGLAATILLLWWSTPTALVNQPDFPELPADISHYVEAQEHAAALRHELIQGTEKRIYWQNEGVRTRYAIVYLPGFSATRQEIAPTAEIVADALGANLFETRLAGHGRATDAMLGVVAEDWLADAAEALAIGEKLGERIILIGTSTGATLALAMAGHPAMDNVESIVMVSPNFAPQDPGAAWLTRPLGPILARIFIGETRSWVPKNQEQALYWSVSYPMATVVEVMRLVDYTQSILPLTMEQSVLTFLSDTDTVVSPEATRKALARIDASREQLIEVEQSGDPSNHVLSGRILSPQQTATIAAQIVEFIQQNAK